MQMSAQFDKETERAWNGWVVFTHFATWSVVIIAAVLALMALFLL
jgi:hypothetical protein